jgi:hypothetical protein
VLRRRPRGRLLRRLSGRSPLLWAILAGIGIVVVAALGARLEGNRPDALSYQVRTFDIATGEIVFDVQKAPPATAACDLRARASDRSLVGRVSGHVVPPRRDGGRSTRVRVVVPLTGRATTVELVSCRITDTGR